MKKAMWTLKELLKSCETDNTNINDKWVPARPENYKKRMCNIFKRIYYAYQVVIGVAETFVWPEGQ